jgi:chromosome segregation ATPase
MVESTQMSDTATRDKDDILSQISEEEHSELVAEIDRLFTSRATAGEQQAEPRRRGVLLPVVVNLAAAVLLAAGIYVVLYFTDTESALRGQTDLQVTQQTVAEALQQEAAEQIAAREAEIAARENQITSIEAELRRLEAERAEGAQTGPTERELELARQLDALIAEQEDAAAAAAAVPEPDTTAADAALAELAALQGRQEFVISQLRELYGDVAGAVATGDAAAVNASISNVEVLLNSPAARDAGLAALGVALQPGNDAILAATTAAATGGETGETPATGPLADIQRLVDQADARLEAGETELAERLYQSAIDTLDGTARAYSQLVTFQAARAEADLQRVNNRLAQVESQLASVRADLRQRNTTIARRDEEIASLSDLVDEQEAELTQLEAELTSIRADLTDERQTVASLRSDLRQRDGQIQSLQAEIAALRETSDERTRSVAQLRADIAAREAELASIRSQVTSLERQVAGEINNLESSTEDELPSVARASSAPERVVDLLGIKVNLREAVDLPAVREEYPQLYDDMELYFDAFATENVLTGRREALSAASAWVEEVLEQVDPAARTFSARASTAEGYLERLETLLTALLENVE